MSLDRKLTLRGLHTELYIVHRKMVDDGIGSDSKLLRLIEQVSNEVNKHPSGWGHEGAGADMPLRLGAWEMQFSGVTKYITE